MYLAVLEACVENGTDHRCAWLTEWSTMSSWYSPYPSVRAVVTKVCKTFYWVLFCVEFGCSPRPCVGFPQAAELSPRLNKLSHDSKCDGGVLTD